MDLYDSNVSDGGIVHLLEMTNLERLDVSKTRISKEGVERLEDGLPNLAVYDNNMKIGEDEEVDE